MIISIADVIKKIDDYILIDVRSPKEYEAGSIKEAISIPILDNEARHLVGTLYRENKEKAYQEGIKHVLPKLPQIQNQLKQFSNKKIIIFCAKGGTRSTSLVKIMNSQNIKCYKLDGGYKEYRKYVIENIDEYIKKINLLVITGNTGSGKTIVLNKLKKTLPVLDLEAYANHRGSIFGEIGLKIVSQKKFEDNLFFELKKIIDHKSKYILIESESRKIGSVSLPNTLYNKMMISPHILLDVSINTRIKIISDMYQVETLDIDFIKKIIIKNKYFKLNLGTAWVNQMIKLLEEKKINQFIKTILIDYYDKLYLTSQKKYHYSLKIKESNLDKITQIIIDHYKNL